MRSITTVLLSVFLAWSVLTASEYRTVDTPVVANDIFTGNPMVKGQSPVTRSMFVLPPGTVLDSSYYDWQRNGTLNRRIWVNDDGSVHATYMKSPDEAFVDRGMIYYYADQFGGPFFSAGNVTGFRNGYGNISSYPTSAPSGAVAVVTTHDFATVRTVALVDAFQGLGAFSELVTNDADQVVWPKPTVNSDGSITIAGTLMNDLQVNGITHNVAWDRAEDVINGFSQTWTFLGQDPARWSGAAMEYPALASSANGKVGIVIGDFEADVHFYESTDNGISFAETLITNAAEDTLSLPSDPDSAATVFLPFQNTDIVYVGEEPHIVWTGLQAARQGEVVIFDFGTRILHWSPSTGIDTVTVSRYQGAIPSEVDTYVLGGANHTTIDWPQIGSSPDGSVLYIVYVGFTPDDVDPVNTLGFGDIWGLFSTDGGETWSDPINISNPDGSFLGTDDRYPSISPVNHSTALLPGMDAYIVYQSDNLAGSFLQGEESANLDYFLFTGVDFDVPSGIEDGQGGTSSLPKAFALEQNYPNPFNPQTTIRFEVPEGENTIDLSIYDSRGRLVTTLFSGQMESGNHEITWNGHDTSGRQVNSGIYFLKLRSSTTSSTIKMVMLK